MRLISCYINGFGKLSETSFEFDKNCSRFCHENGYGKSTLAAFIRVMFYGFSGESKRSELENERKRFKPWQGGIYGGNLTFETNGNTYTITRTFGDKDKDDVFELRNTDTNIVSGDFSEKIGEELFQIDLESFKRTVFISQNECETEVNGSINAKLGNVAENTNDINNFEKADERLKDWLNAMSPRRKTGSLNRLKNDIAELEIKVKNGEAIDVALANDLKRIEAIKAEQAKLRERQQELKLKQQEISIYNDLKAQREEYEKLCAAYKDREAEVARQRGLFKGTVPEENELATYINNTTRLAALNENVENYRFTEAEKQSLERSRKVLKGTQPKKQDFDSCREKIAELYELRVKFAENEADRAKKKVLFILLGLVIAILGAAILFKSIPFGVGGIIAGSLIVAATCVINQKYKSEDDEELKAAENAIDDFFAAYDLTEFSNEKDYSKLLYEFERLCGNIETLEEKEKSFREAVKLYKDRLSSIKSYIESLMFEPSDNLHEQLLLIKQYRQQFDMAVAELDKAKKEKEKFEMAHKDYVKFESMKALENSALTLENIADEAGSITDRLDELQGMLTEYMRRKEQSQEERNSIFEAEAMLLECKEKYAEDELKFKRIEKVRELLNEAKEDFTAKYTGPILAGFKKYYKLLTGREASEHFIDANIKLTVAEQGLQRDTSLFSTGYRDLLGICMRMALVDAMYKEEKPFIVFDDPYTNLDLEKTERGIELLEEISKEYQIIYFTCHESRSHL